MKQHRLARVAEAIREVASETILFGLRDPRIKGVTVTRTEVSGDLQHAKIFVSIMGTESERRTCMYGLRNACGYLQSQLADRLQMRFTPTLQIIEDTGVKNSLEVSRLINEAMASLPKTDHAGEQQPATSDDADGSAPDRQV